MGAKEEDVAVAVAAAVAEAEADINPRPFYQMEDQLYDPWHSCWSTSIWFAYQNHSYCSVYPTYPDYAADGPTGPDGVDSH